jgi:hypothetical protein
MVKLKIIIIIISIIIIITRPTTLAPDMVARPKVAWIWHGVHKSNFHLPLSYRFILFVNRPILTAKPSILQNVVFSLLFIDIFYEYPQRSVSNLTSVYY